MTLAKLIVSALLACSAAATYGLEVKPYSVATLDAAQKTDKPVALHFRADWCPTCRAQDKVLESLKSEPGLALTVLAVNYDTEKDLKRRFGVNAQSTLVVLKGKKETGRLVGETSRQTLLTALKSPL